MEGSENRIAEARARKNLKQVDLANLLRMSRGQLANLEAGTRKVDLPELRRIARTLDCTVVDLLLPEDAPNQPNETETKLLAEMRAMEGYDPRAILLAARSVMEAMHGITSLQMVPKNLQGDPSLASAMAERWGDLDDAGRRKALHLLDTAREFGR